MGEGWGEGERKGGAFNSPYAQVERCSQALYNSLLTSLGGLRVVGSPKSCKLFGVQELWGARVMGYETWTAIETPAPLLPEK